MHSAPGSGFPCASAAPKHHSRQRHKYEIAITPRAARRKPTAQRTHAFDFQTQIDQRLLPDFARVLLVQSAAGAPTPAPSNPPSVAQYQPCLRYPPPQGPQNGRTTERTGVGVPARPPAAARVGVALAGWVVRAGNPLFILILFPSALGSGSESGSVLEFTTKPPLHHIIKSSHVNS